MPKTIKTTTAKEFYDSVDAICHAGLKSTLNRETHVYDLQIMDKNQINTYEYYPTEDLTSTAICLIGITRAQIAPESLDLDIQQTLESLYDLSKKRHYAGGFGLIVWANAVCNGLDIETLQFRCGVSLDNISKHCASLTTMEVSWLASGLAHELKRSGNDKTRALLDVAVDELINVRFQKEHSAVSHTSDKSGGHDVRRWIANFADQVYTIQALAFTAIVTKNDQAQQVSDAIAAKMVELQGDKGQWWWHYDAKRGGVPQPYSVYSVHQHGMAPMALRALESAGGTAHENAIVMSRSWLDDNELGVKMVDPDQPTIWRSIEYNEGKLSDITRKTRSLLGLAGDQSRSPAPALKMNFETRPYEWAWCIYAGAIERKIDPTLHIV